MGVKFIIRKSSVTGILLFFLFFSIFSNIVVSRNNILFTGNQTSNLTGLDWPMFCHDLRHTGRSLYNTNNNLNEIKWRFKAGKHASCGSPVIGSDGVIYFPAGGVLCGIILCIVVIARRFFACNAAITFGIVIT